MLHAAPKRGVGTDASVPLGPIEAPGKPANGVQDLEVVARDLSFWLVVPSVEGAVG